MPSSTNHPLEITIADDSKAEKCDIRCGADWSSPETLTLANQRIKDRFDAKIKLKYLDLTKPIIDHNAQELKQQVKAKNLPLPLLIINGELRISGQFDIRLLLDAIEAEMEMKA